MCFYICFLSCVALPIRLSQTNEERPSKTNEHGRSMKNKEKKHDTRRKWKRTEKDEKWGREEEDGKRSWWIFIFSTFLCCRLLLLYWLSDEYKKVKNDKMVMRKRRREWTCFVLFDCVERFSLRFHMQVWLLHSDTLQLHIFTFSQIIFIVIDKTYLFKEWGKKHIFSSHTSEATKDVCFREITNNNLNIFSFIPSFLLLCPS